MKSDLDYELRIAQAAYEDLKDIQAYTFLEYGEEQWRKHEASLDKALKHILAHPFSGHHRDDLPPEYHAWNVGQHIIIFRIESNLIFVVRVLHQKMDFTYKFQ